MAKLAEANTLAWPDPDGTATFALLAIEVMMPPVGALAVITKRMPVLGSMTGRFAVMPLASLTMLAGAGHTPTPLSGNAAGPLVPVQLTDRKLSRFSGSGSVNTAPAGNGPLPPLVRSIVYVTSSPAPACSLSTCLVSAIPAAYGSLTDVEAATSTDLSMVLPVM